MLFGATGILTRYFGMVYSILRYPFLGSSAFTLPYGRLFLGSTGGSWTSTRVKRDPLGGALCFVTRFYGIPKVIYVALTCPNPAFCVDTVIVPSQCLRGTTAFLTRGYGSLLPRASAELRHLHPRTALADRSTTVVQRKWQCMVRFRLRGGRRLVPGHLRYRTMSRKIPGQTQDSIMNLCLLLQPAAECFECCGSWRLLR